MNAPKLSQSDQEVVARAKLFIMKYTICSACEYAMQDPNSVICVACKKKHYDALIKEMEKENN